MSENSLNKAGKGTTEGVWYGWNADPIFFPDDKTAEVRRWKTPALVVAGGRLVWLGDYAELPSSYSSWTKHAVQNCLLTPGLVDCHTHLVYAGNRSKEWGMRLAGARYEEIAQAGGGILSTVLATREMDEDTLFLSSAKRLQHWLRMGVSALEIKSGYGLNQEGERKQLRVARRLAQVYGITVRTSCLAAHALPPEYQGRADDYIEWVCDTLLPSLAEEGLVDAVDVFCEKIAFTLKQTERVFDTAVGLKLPVRLHAEQLSDMGGSVLAARYLALSCDHLEYLSPAGVKALKESGTVAVLLPGAWYFLRETKLPPVNLLREAGVPIAVATDHNPGTSPILSPLLCMNMAATLFHLTIPEVLHGFTRHSARALGLEKTDGVLDIGRSADFVVWDVPSATDLVYSLGHNPCRYTVMKGLIRSNEQYTDSVLP